MDTHNGLPQYAPLPAPFVAHLRTVRAPRVTKRLTPGTILEAQQRIQEAEHALRTLVAHARDQVTALLEPLVVSDALRMKELRRLLNEVTATPKRFVAEQTLRNWRQRGLLRMDRYGHPTPESAAAVLIMRLCAPPIQRDWLPAMIDQDEPAWWCWRLDSPTAAPKVCPVPIVTPVPPGSLLWTPWRGAAWRDPWVATEGGAARWGGAVTWRMVQEWEVPLDLLRGSAALTDVLPADVARSAARHLAVGVERKVAEQEK
ncbi:MAG: hypothetical protein KatS3mg057_0124 [Herpetosiphonaceae bacterium]|nr:MAG: hypothetical protein KatS3mg057_0124 [Herpetosiphonaceae bacterium]